MKKSSLHLNDPAIKQLVGEAYFENALLRKKINSLEHVNRSLKEDLHNLETEILERSLALIKGKKGLRDCFGKLED